MRVGGRAEWLLEPADPDELRAAWCAVREADRELRVLGGGANLLIQDGVLPGVVLSTERLRRVFRPEAGAREGDAFGTEVPRLVQVDRAEAEPRLVAWCGASLPGLVRTAMELGWSGLEGLVGVPGSLGGGVAMNAGGRWGDLWDVVESVRLLTPGGELIDRPREACAPGYRDGGVGEALVVGAVLALERSTRAAVQERMRAFLAEKKRAQPVTEASSGCIFRNPDPELSEGRSAGLLIEASGCKGLARGDAVVSELHGNFIVNRGRARAADVFALIAAVRERVLLETGIELATEVRVWGAGEPAPEAPPEASGGP